MREAAVESRLIRAIARLGGRCVKLNPTAAVGIPDRLILLDGYVGFIEVKASGGRVSEKQKQWRDWLTAHGFNHEIVIGTDGVDAYIQRLNERKDPNNVEHQATNDRSRHGGRRDTQ